MNLATMALSINRCEVCSYPFSDKHHIWPQSKGGKELTTIHLCPNHHRFANIVQLMALQQMTDEQIKAFAADHFDPAFNEQALDYLLIRQQQLKRVIFANIAASLATTRILLSNVEVLTDDRDGLIADIERLEAALFLEEQQDRLTRFSAAAMISQATFTQALDHIAALLDCVVSE